MADEAVREVEAGSGSLAGAAASVVFCLHRAVSEKWSCDREDSGGENGWAGRFYPVA